MRWRGRSGVPGDAWAVVMSCIHDSTGAADAMKLLNHSGWSIGDIGLATTGGMIWLVAGHNIDNVIRAEGATQREA